MLRRLGKYELLDEIGHGGMATVYRARDERLDRMVAIKVLHPHLQKAPEARIRFSREARSVAKLEHPHIVQVYDYSGEDSEESYIAAELLTGPTLKRFSEDHPEIPPEIAACMSLQIARALGAAHARGIVHRDVKPENVLLHERRLVKLTDFGIAQAVDSQSFTATGQILGSPGHMAPEQIEGGEVDARTDLFSLGTVLYFLAVGRLPFTGRNPHQVLKRIVDGEYADPLRVRPAIGAPLRGIIARALARSPDDRFESAEAFVQALADYLASVGVDDPDAELTAYLADPPTQTESIRARVLSHLLERGRRAVAVKDRTTAVQCFDRILAMDEGNEEVLRLLERLGRGDRRLVYAGVVAVVVGALALTLTLWPSGETPPSSLDAGVLATEDAGPEDAGADAATDTDGGPVDGGLADGGLADGGPTDTGAEEPPERDPQRRRPTGPRLVEINPSPPNVRVSVDGAPPREWGPRFRSVELDPGPHTFRFDAPSGCCEPLELDVRIPPGEGAYALQARLTFRPARLYVTTIPSDVAVVAGRGAAASGRARSIIAVPMATSEEIREFRVTADGHEVYTGRVTLRAGELTNVSAALRPVP
ncbi:MAG: serine/threonine protein kinase [Sandaracinus sp.]|nr:serine/threonine protein kinase [Sandaracinus sp.]